MAELGSLPLYALFEELRRQGLPLSVSEYADLFEVLRGKGVTNAQELEELCCLLWAKSSGDRQIVSVAFANFVEPCLRPEAAPRPITAPIKHSPPNTSLSKAQPQQKTAPPELPETESPQAEPIETEPPKTEPPEIKPLETEPSTPERQFSSDVSPSTTQFQSRERSTLTPSPDGYTFQKKEVRRAFQLTPRLPITRREVATNWKYLRRFQRTGIPMELDLEATIESLCRTGYLLRPVLRPHRRHQASVVLLVDRSSSMVPFSLLVRAIVEGLSQSGLLNNPSPYYFQNCPQDLVYQTPKLTQPIALETVLDMRASILILSDAGAARGYYDGDRLRYTEQFLKQVQAYTHRCVWLNPVPRPRWRTTTAAAIARWVPMFPLDREGMYDAIGILRGHPPPPEVNRL